MFAEFMLDNTLRQHAVVITAVGAPLEQKYADDLRAQAGNEAERLAWCVDRARGVDWWKTTRVPSVCFRTIMAGVYVRFRIGSRTQLSP